MVNIFFNIYVGLVYSGAGISKLPTILTPMKHLIFILAIFCSLSSYSQIAYKNQKIKLINIDTTEILIYESQSIKLYFSQNDILTYFEKVPSDEKKIFDQFIDTLITNTNQIHIFSDTIYDAVFERKLNGAIQSGVFPSGKDKRDYLSNTFMFIAVELMLEGKFKLYSKKQKRFITKDIKVRKRKDNLGNRFLDFNIKKDETFYEVIFSLGE